MKTDIDRKRKFTSTPWGIASALGVPLYDNQRKVLLDCLLPGAVTLKAANESGKTTRIAAFLVLWHATAFKKSVTVLTSGSWRQVEEQLFPAIAQYGRGFSDWEFTKTGFTTPSGSRCVGISTNDPGKFEGWHAEDHVKHPLLMIVDEAKTVPDQIFQAIERCKPTRLLLLSSPGFCSGQFYQSFTTLAKFYKQHSITAADCPHISKESVDRQIAQWGVQHPLIRSMIFAEFMQDEAGSMLVCPLAKIEQCQKNPPLVAGGDCVAFCDFAAGGDENVIALRRGNQIKELICWHETNTMAGVGRFLIELSRMMREHGLPSGNVFGDEGGLGKPMCDRLAEGGLQINRVNNQSAAYDKEHFGNRGTEMWCAAAREIEKCKIILPSDSVAIGQLASRRFTSDSRGRIILESKDEMRARGLQSPDRADALVGAISNRSMQPINYTVQESPGRQRWSFDEPEIDEPDMIAIPGADAGR